MRAPTCSTDRRDDVPSSDFASRSEGEAGRRVRRITTLGFRSLVNPYLFPLVLLCVTQSISQLRRDVAPPFDQAVT
jgi:hypothetical protein